MGREMSDFDDAIRKALGEAPMRLLTRLLGAGCEHAVGMCDDVECFYCGAWLGFDHPHAPDCPYVEAITLYGDPDGAKPTGILKA